MPAPLRDLNSPYLSLYLDANLAHRLRQEAADTGVSLSAIVRSALIERYHQIDQAARIMAALEDEGLAL